MTLAAKGCEFEPQLGKHSFRRLTKVIVTSVIGIPPMGNQSMWKSSQLPWKNVVWSTGVRQSRNIWVGELALSPNQLSKNWLWTKTSSMGYKQDLLKQSNVEIPTPIQLSNPDNFQRWSRNVVSTLKLQRCFNVDIATLFQRWYRNVYTTFKYNHFSTLWQRWSTTLFQRWFNVVAPAGKHI